MKAQGEEGEMKAERLPLRIMLRISCYPLYLKDTIVCVYLI